MSEFSDTRREMAERLGKMEPTGPRDYTCIAHGCPNAGSMDNGTCFFHWRESDSLKWATVTQEIRENTDRMRNHGAFSPELQAKYRATSQALFPGVGKPRGLLSSTGGE